MQREISAGGVVVREAAGGWEVAVIEPEKGEGVVAQVEVSAGTGGAGVGGASTGRTRKAVFALPKGLLDAGERAEQAAVREVREETGLIASPVVKLADTRYVYVRTWGDRERVFKIVTFYLLRYESGTIGEIAPEMRIEVKQALWVPLQQASKKLSYSNERKVVALAVEYVRNHEAELREWPQAGQGRGIETS